ncbi:MULTISPECIES: MerR family transcriptional regulator [unclassified Paenibacillus]|uniref:MerR family transcriptional regulator n=1 Tax=unclassified Paenibacillus TaxID=185978 RepID=UPI0003E23180|nr:MULTISPECIES: MerR family transcriptional regulator [unclassified Paenibacillus]ETT54582.1 transcriptional regulator [Paenibacillus sp. FSL R7-269]OMF96926.1 transcriptional regulator [Paenibacillus sp. FSL R7-0337]
MRDEITISELAKLMNVSVHQIRYFEEKGVLQPAYTGENQYRMYSMDQVYQLAHILLLRKLEVPVQSINECMSYSPEQHRGLLEHSLEGIEQELARLQELRQFIRKMLEEEQSYSSQAEPFQRVQQSEVYLTEMMKLDSYSQLSAALLAEQAAGIPNLFESDIYYVADEQDTVTLYLEGQAPGDLTLPAGEYLTLQCVIQEEELEEQCDDFFTYAAAEAIPLAGPLVVIERSYLSLFAPGKLHYELKALIQPGAPAQGTVSL